MKLPNWMYTEIRFGFVNRWKDWVKYHDYFCIWLGTEFQRGDSYRKYANCYSLDFTICNFGFKLHIRGNPPISFALLKQKKHGVQAHNNREPKLLCPKCGCSEIISLDMWPAIYTCTKCKQEWRSATSAAR